MLDKLATLITTHWNLRGKIKWKNAIIYIHGKNGTAEEVEHYKPIFENTDVIGFDYKAQNPWEAKE